MGVLVLVLVLLLYIAVNSIVQLFEPSAFAFAGRAGRTMYQGSGITITI